MKIALYSPVLPSELWRRQYAVSILKGFLAVGWQVDVLGGSDVAPSDFDNLGTYVSVDVPKADNLSPPSFKRLRQVSELGQELSRDYELFISLESPVPLFNQIGRAHV